MDRYKVRIRVEIVPAGAPEGSDGGGGSLDGIDEEAVETISAEQAAENAYEVMRRALGKHLSEVSKRGLSPGSDQPA